MSKKSPKPAIPNLSHQQKVEALRTIVNGLSGLRGPAKQAGVDDVEGIINAAYTMCASYFYLQLRGELVE